MSQDVVAKVCAIPAVFRKDPDTTLRSLMEASGYEHAREKVTVAELQRHLSSHPELVEAWQRYSEDKRVESGWYLEGLVVGYYEPGKGMGRKERHPDAAGACAAFVKKEMEAMAG